MVEPRLPEPMTPERADLLVRRWRLATTLIAFAGLALLWASPPFAALVWLSALTICLRHHANNQGWLNGYRAARREELERQASGDPR